MKKLSMMQKIVVQIVLWTIWYTIKGLGLFVYWSTTPKLPVVYNYLSIVVVFYAVYFLSKNQIKHINYIDFQRLGFFKKVNYLFINRYVAGIIVVMIVYVLTSWYVDYFIFNSRYPDLFLYFNGRLSKEMEYIPIAIGCSFFFEYAKRQGVRHQVNQTRIYNLKDYIEKQHTEQMEALEFIKNAYQKSK
jgi:hypothetical protein